jgi:hypothetical protein
MAFQPNVEENRSSAEKPAKRPPKKRRERGGQGAWAKSTRLLGG